MTISDVGKSPGPRGESLVPGQTRRRVVVEDVELELDGALDKIRKRAVELRDEDATIHITLTTKRNES